MKFEDKVKALSDSELKRETISAMCMAIERFLEPESDWHKKSKAFKEEAIRRGIFDDCEDEVHRIFTIW